MDRQLIYQLQPQLSQRVPRLLQVTRHFRVGRMFLYPDHTHDYRKELNLTQKGLRIVIDLSVWHIKL